MLILSTYCNWSSYGSLRKVSTASENQSGHSLTGQSGCYGPDYRPVVPIKIRTLYYSESFYPSLLLFLVNGEQKGEKLCYIRICDPT